MKRCLACVLITVLMFCLSACSVGDDVDMDALRVAMLKADSSIPSMKTVSDADADSEKLFSSLSDIDYDLIDRFFLSYSSQGKAYEIAAVKLKNESDRELLEKSLNSHKEYRVRLYKAYSPEEVPMAESASIFSVGKYTFFVMCADVEAVSQAARSVIG